MFLTIKLYLHLNCVLLLNWIVWNVTIFDIKTVPTQKWFVSFRSPYLILDWIILIITVWINWIAWNRNVFDN